MVAIRLSAYVDFYLPEGVSQDSGQLASLLSRSTPACMAVKAYWQRVDPDDDVRWWDSWLVSKVCEENYIAQECWGPGGIGFVLGCRIANIYGLARWRGFLSFPPLRQVHRTAFTAIAEAVGATQILYVPDSEDILLSAMHEGRTFEECLQLAEAKWGPAQGSLDDISNSVIADCDSCSPSVWYFERLTSRS